MNGLSGVGGNEAPGASYSRSFSLFCKVTWEFDHLTVADLSDMTLHIKGALCHFGENILIRREGLID